MLFSAAVVRLHCIALLYTKNLFKLDTGNGRNMNSDEELLQLATDTCHYSIGLPKLAIKI